MLELVRSDLRRFVAPSSRHAAAAELRVLLNLGSQALLVYRLGRWLRAGRRRPARWLPTLLLWPVYRLLAGYVRLAYDVRLDPSADIGAGLKIFHFGGIRLRSCKLGQRCAIHQEVIVEPAARGAPGPDIGDRVWIGPHARIVGHVRVGDGATVAAGALVTQDVAAATLVVGAPARTALVNYDNRAIL